QLARGVGQAGIVDAATYLGEFVSELAATMACESYAIRFSAPTSAPLPSCKATLLAQLTSELVINAYKHAFEGQETGEIRVTLERGDAGFRLVVADNCIGLPEHFDPEASDGIGMRLISGFAAQIGGELHIVTGDPGASFAVTFPG
ncbi:MAG: sensor histidine kinase, partial [Acetobacterales bacterium]